MPDPASASSFAPPPPDATPGQTLVLGTAIGCGLCPEIRVFVESLRRHYRGEIQILVTSKSPPDLIDYLRQWGVTPRLFDSALWMSPHVQLTRYVRYLEILRESQVTYDRILLTDVIDVLFQDHPLTGAPEGDLLFFMEDSRRTIGLCPDNSRWVRQVFGRTVLADLAGEVISCSGTTIGTHAAIVDYLSLLLSHVRPDVMAAVREWRGHDQGIHNYLLHTGAIPRARRIENGIWVHTLGSVPDSEVSVADDSVRTAQGDRCPIVHQWNYRPEVAAWVSRTWKP